MGKVGLGIDTLSEDYAEVILKPSGFSEPEKMQYQDFLVGNTKKIITEAQKDRFEKRKNYEAEVYVETLFKKMYVTTFNGKRFAVEVALPTILFMCGQIASYVSAFELARTA